MDGRPATPLWDAGLARALAGRPIVYLGAGTGPVHAVAAAGADVRAAVELVVSGTEAGCTPWPLLTIETPARSATEVQVPLFPDVLEARAHEVAAFLARHDPEGEAVVLAPLPVPSAAVGGRARWTCEPALARDLEAKRATGHPFDTALPWVRTEAVPARVDASWWVDVTGRMSCTRLVVQSVGLHAGGETTWVCGSVVEAAAAAARAGDCRVAACIEGVSVNVTGCVGARGAVLVLPPTRQLRDETTGTARYAGNSIEGITEEAAARLVEGARHVGRVLAGRGYLGTYGLDAIVTTHGRPVYHDLNARVNGAVHAFDLGFPALAGLLAAPGWLDPALVDPVEAEVRAHTADRPVARWALTQVVTEPTRVGVLRAGVYRIDRAHQRAVHIDGRHRADAVQGDLVLVRPRPLPGGLAQEGDVVVVADLWCGTPLAKSFEAELGGQAMTALLALVREASSG